MPRRAGSPRSPPSKTGRHVPCALRAGQTRARAPPRRVILDRESWVRCARRTENACCVLKDMVLRTSGNGAPGCAQPHAGSHKMRLCAPAWCGRLRLRRFRPQVDEANSLAKRAARGARSDPASIDSRRRRRRSSALGLDLAVLSAAVVRATPAAWWCRSDGSLCAVIVFWGTSSVVRHYGYTGRAPAAGRTCSRAGDPARGGDGGRASAAGVLPARAPNVERCCSSRCRSWSCCV